MPHTTMFFAGYNKKGRTAGKTGSITYEIQVYRRHSCV